MNWPRHLNLWMKVLIHQQLPVWRWTAHQACLGLSLLVWEGLRVKRQKSCDPVQYFPQKSHLPGDTAAASVSGLCEQHCPSLFSALSADKAADEWRGHLSGVKGQQLSLRSGRSCRVWMWPPAWPGNLGVFLFPWYLKELFVLCPHLPTSAHRAVWPHSGQYFPVYNGSCRCVLDVHNCLVFVFFFVFMYASIV